MMHGTTNIKLWDNSLIIKDSPAEIQTGYVLNREQGVTATCSVPQRKLGGYIKKGRAELIVCWRDRG